MNKTVFFTISVSILAMLMLCSCSLGWYSTSKEECDLTVSDRITISYNERDYVIINERLYAAEIGKWVGVVNKNLSGVMFASVYTDKENTDMINISVNDTFFRAIAADKLSSEMSLFELGAYSSFQTGAHTVTIDENNALQLHYNGNTYAVTDRRIARRDLGSYVCSIARSLTCDADSGRIIPKDESLAIDWDGTLKQNRRLLNYTNVYLVKNTDELAVCINGEFYIANKL